MIFHFVIFKFLYLSNEADGWIRSVLNMVGGGTWEMWIDEII